MNKIHRNVEYALMALKELSQRNSEQPISVKEISEKIGSPFDATARVMQQMSQVGLLKSEQGVRGGYSMIKNLRAISFHELLEAVLGPIEIAKCLHVPPHCQMAETCNIQTPVTGPQSKDSSSFTLI